jgi:hypothetical protein
LPAVYVAAEAATYKPRSHKPTKRLATNRYESRPAKPANRYDKLSRIAEGKQVGKLLCKKKTHRRSWVVGT